MTTVQNDDGGNRYTIQSVDVALHVRQKLADHGKPLTLSELSEISHEPASKLHRYLSTFSLMDFVVQNQKHGTYALGRGCIQLGLAAMRQVDLFSRVDAGLQKLTEDTSCHSFIAIWTMAGPIIVRWVYSQDSIVVNIIPGHMLPVTRSSAGRVFAAFLSHAQTEPFIKRELIPFGEDPDYEKLIRKRIADVLNDRYAISRGEVESHLKSISVPVLDWHDSSIVVAGCVMSVDADENRTHAVLSILKKFAEDRSLRPTLNFFAAAAANGSAA